jgi:hypothetical protein
VRITNNLPPGESSGGLLLYPFWLAVVFPAFGFCKLFGLPFHNNDAYLQRDAFCCTLLVNAVIGSVLGLCLRLLFNRFCRGKAQKS